MHNRDILSARFWPEATQSRAHANLRTTLWSLRQAVGPDAVLATRTAVGLHEPAWWIDLREIRTLTDWGELTAAVALSAGELVPDLVDDWASDARREHRERRITLLDRLADQSDAAGEPTEAARLSRLRCALTPFDEPAHRALLRRLTAAGDRAGALLASREFVDRLRTELGVRPGPATRSVLAEVRGAVASSTDTARRQPPLFGRAAELRALVEAWTAARDGQGRVVVVTGEAGIGKTRLISELASRAAKSGARVAVGSGVDVGGEAPLALWQELANELVRSLPSPHQQASAERAATAFETAEQPALAFAGLVTAACGLAAGADMDAALRTADRALTLTRGVPVLTLPCLAARAHLLSRLERHGDAVAAAREQLTMAERLDSPSLVALAQNDAGLVTLAAGLHDEAAHLLAAALAGDAMISRPATRLARAEALAHAGHADAAAAEVRLAALEPVGPGDQPWALVPQMSRVQGLIALARGDLADSRRRMSEAVAGWQRRRPPDAGEELMANLVYLARPPVVGLVEAARELDRVCAELAEITELT